MDHNDYVEVVAQMAVPFTKTCTLVGAEGGACIALVVKLTRLVKLFLWRTSASYKVPTLRGSSSTSTKASASKSSARRIFTSVVVVKAGFDASIAISSSKVPVEAMTA